MYSSAKFAVTGLSEALAVDLKPLGIHVTAVLPGLFRTSFAKPGSIAFSEKQIADYHFLRTAHQRMNEVDGRQPGDPGKVAGALLELVNHPNPPTLLFLGSDAYTRATAKMAQSAQEMEQWKTVSFSTDFE
jgi:NAD(P)-dependent dehydrogenase (short-subunit alcohol dehydrogenase family)